MYSLCVYIHIGPANALSEREQLLPHPATCTSQAPRRLLPETHSCQLLLHHIVSLAYDVALMDHSGTFLPPARLLPAAHQPLYHLVPNALLPLET